jgi:hypothetical protein
MTPRILIAGLVLGAGLLAGCASPSSGGGGHTVIKTISGTVTGGTNVKIGIFYDATNAVSFYNTSEPELVDPGTPQVLAYQTLSPGFITTGGFAPLSFVTPDLSGNYSLTFPASPKATIYVIAWEDTTSNGDFDLGTENGLFPMKSITGTLRAIEGFGYADLGGGQLYYLADYWNSTDSIYHNDGLDIIGATGFNFAF